MHVNFRDDLLSFKHKSITFWNVNDEPFPNLKPPAKLGTLSSSFISFQSIVPFEIFNQTLRRYISPQSAPNLFIGLYVFHTQQKK